MSRRIETPEQKVQRQRRINDYCQQCQYADFKELFHSCLRSASPMNLVYAGGMAWVNSSRFIQSMPIASADASGLGTVPLAVLQVPHRHDSRLASIVR